MVEYYSMLLQLVQPDEVSHLPRLLSNTLPHKKAVDLLSISFVLSATFGSLFPLGWYLSLKAEEVLLSGHSPLLPQNQPRRPGPF